jgi:crotonobetainyl-CoA:carnitine CoA-transferase CaiB-like acyl-CoA transferase
VVELASDHAAFAGKLLGEFGAEVILVEPPSGHRSRLYAPFAGDDQEDPERSLWWWWYNSAKRGVTIDLNTDGDVFDELLSGADVVLEGEAPGRLARLGLDYSDLKVSYPSLIWASVTPFGRTADNAAQETTDLTVLAGGGPVWSCGYDDHTIPPVRGGGNQGYQIASIWAAIGILVAITARDLGNSGGQLIDVSMHAAANVTTEMGSYEWLVRRATVHRQTCRHATAELTAETAAVARDGIQITTGMPPRTPKEFEVLRDWVNELGLREDFDDYIFLELGTERERINSVDLVEDGEAAAIFTAGRDALSLIASQVDAYEFFLTAQGRGLACGVVNAPEELVADPQFRQRGFFVEVDQMYGEHTIVFPGAPFIAPASPWRTFRAPHLGEHNADAIIKSTTSGS